jgi:hypothetical protein
MKAPDAQIRCGAASQGRLTGVRIPTGIRAMRFRAGGAALGVSGSGVNADGEAVLHRSRAEAMRAAVRSSAYFMLSTIFSALRTKSIPISSAHLA